MASAERDAGVRLEPGAREVRRDPGVEVGAAGSRPCSWPNVHVLAGRRIDDRRRVPGRVALAVGPDRPRSGRARAGQVSWAVGCQSRVAEATTGAGGSRRKRARPGAGLSLRPAGGGPGLGPAAAGAAGVAAGEVRGARGRASTWMRTTPAYAAAAAASRGSATHIGCPTKPAPRPVADAAAAWREAGSGVPWRGVGGDARAARARCGRARTRRTLPRDGRPSSPSRQPHALAGGRLHAPPGGSAGARVGGGGRRGRAATAVAASAATSARAAAGPRHRAHRARHRDDPRGAPDGARWPSTQAADAQPRPLSLPRRAGPAQRARASRTSTVCVPGAGTANLTAPTRRAAELERPRCPRQRAAARRSATRRRTRPGG